jgi:hypothetical protein
MQKRRFIGRGLCIPRTSFSVRPGVQFDRNSVAIRLVLMIARRAVPLLMIASTPNKAASERPAWYMLELAPVSAVDVVEATEWVEIFDSRRTPRREMSMPGFGPVSCEPALAFLRTLKLEEVEMI